MIMVGEIVANARSNDHNPRDIARSNDFRGMIPTGPMTRSTVNMATR